MRVLADSNIQKSTVLDLRGDGHDVVWVMERPADPGDAAILNEARATRRVLITADKGFGRLTQADRRPHHGIILVDDTPTLAVQSGLIRDCLKRFDAALGDGAFLRVTADGRVRRRKRDAKRQ